jgi:hypothetical protein
MAIAGKKEVLFYGKKYVLSNTTKCGHWLLYIHTQSQSLQTTLNPGILALLTIIAVLDENLL